MRSGSWASSRSQFGVCSVSAGDQGVNILRCYFVE